MHGCLSELDNRIDQFELGDGQLNWLLSSANRGQINLLANCAKYNIDWKTIKHSGGLPENANISSKLVAQISTKN